MSENESNDEGGDAYRKYLFEFDNWIASRNREWSFQDVHWRVDQIIEIAREDPEDYPGLKKFRKDLVKSKKALLNCFFFKA
jgi:hypothetical protein